MTNQLTNFAHATFGNVRTTIDEATGEPLFVAKDVAEVLGYSNPRKAIIDHCKSVTKRDAQNSRGQLRKASFIPERDLYRLVIRSKLPAAEQFEEWVVGTVLPSIRKHGGYVLGQEEETDPKVILAKALKIADSVIEEKERLLVAQKQQIQELKPKATLVDETFVDDSQAVPLQNFARTLPRLNQNMFKGDLLRLKYLYRVGRNQTYRRYAKHSNYLTEKYDPSSQQHTICVTKVGQLHFTQLYQAGVFTLRKG